ncbi:MAG: hypothetical protein WD184_05435 [Acidimicrobiia bacterium]
MAYTARVAGAVVLLLVAACGGDAAPSTTTPTTAPTTTTLPATTTTTTTPPTTTTVALDCHSYGDAMGGIAQSLLYQTFDAAAVLGRQGDEAADALLTVSAAIGSLADQIEALGTPLPGFDEAVGMMLQAMEMDEEGYAAASDAARAGDDAALAAAVATVDEGFLLIMAANVALSTAQECSEG